MRTITGELGCLSRGPAQARPVRGAAAHWGRAAGLLLLLALAGACAAVASSAPVAGVPVSGGFGKADAGRGASASGRGPLPSIDVNAASPAELERVRGIGPALASRIAAARSTGGPFRDTDDLRRRVRGVGEANLRRMLASGLVLGGAARIVPVKAAARDRVHLLVGNVPAKSEFRGLGRIEELGCCGSRDAGETHVDRGTGHAAAVGAEPGSAGSSAMPGRSGTAFTTAESGAFSSAASTEPKLRSRVRR